VAENVVGEDPRYVHSLTPDQVDGAWKAVGVNFHQCPTCLLLVCPSCYDAKSGYCQDDSPRREEIAQAETEQAVGVVKGLADAFGFGEVVRSAGQAVKQAAAQSARCPKDGTLATPGTKFCPECGSAMIQPVAAACPSCGADTKGAKFCPECGTKIEQVAAATKCASCGAELKGAKFCPECGTRAV
jgi:hypothetical protein